MVWPFPKTYKVKGPNGQIKTVYRDVNDAFPLYIKGWKANLKAAVKVLDKASVDIKAEHATAIHGLLFAVDEFNQGLMMTFRGAYILYQSDPYEHSGFFEREVAKLLDEQKRLRILKVKIDGLIELAKLQSEHSDEFVKVLANIVDSVDPSIAPQVASQRSAEKIAEAKQITKKSAEDQHED